MNHPEIRNCHSYKDFETAANFSWIHPAANVQVDVIQKILNPCGTVLDQHPVVCPRTKYETGGWIFVMRTEDLEKTPLPLYANICGYRTDITYRNRKSVCFECRSHEHLADKCPSLNQSGYQDNSNEVPSVLGHSNHLQQSSPPTVIENLLSTKDLSKENFEALPTATGVKINPFLMGQRPEDEAREKGEQSKISRKKIKAVSKKTVSSSSELPSTSTLTNVPALFLMMRRQRH